ncbi:ACH1-like protein [Mya arenaria]|uniref:ACH1-like protein n=1 Tax=Mya arenaria TaxID=6604 RepID=A0ABY7DNR9_MYAAR|nr:ACH1-like protein [Mya arenaria]
MSLMRQIMLELENIQGLSCYVDIGSNMISMLLTCYSANVDFETKFLITATDMYSGLIIWEPPAIYKSVCIIDVEYVSFDAQNYS